MVEVAEQQEHQEQLKCVSHTSEGLGTGGGGAAGDAAGKRSAWPATGGRQEDFGISWRTGNRTDSEVPSETKTIRCSWYRSDKVKGPQSPGIYKPDVLSRLP